MQTQHRLRRAGQYAALALLLTLASTLPAAADFEERATFDSSSLKIVNLIGTVQVEGHNGSAFEVDVQVRGRDATRQQVTVETRDGSEAELVIRFPVDEVDRFIYPELGNSRTKLNLPLDTDDDGGSLLSAIFSTLADDQIEVRGSGRGREMWADITVRVPADRKLAVVVGAGKIRAANASGDLRFDTHSGRIDLAQLSGRLTADTGSGSIKAQGLSGSFINLDTGSGSVSVEDVRGDKLRVDTGSGSVELQGIETAELLVDTGSGRVKALDVATDSANIDTGSGSVELQLTRMGGGRFRIDTGSGGIRLHLPADASASVTADTGSGGVQIDYPGVEFQHKERDQARFRIGGGQATMVLDTGSGGIRIDRGE